MIICRDDEKRKLLKKMEMRKIKFTGHINRHKGFITNIFESKVFSKNGIGRPRKKFLEDTYKKIECGFNSK